jgi:hypothetical protein
MQDYSRESSPGDARAGVSHVRHVSLETSYAFHYSTCMKRLRAHLRHLTRASQLASCKHGFGKVRNSWHLPAGKQLINELMCAIKHLAWGIIKYCGTDSHIFRIQKHDVFVVCLLWPLLFCCLILHAILRLLAGNLTISQTVSYAFLLLESRRILHVAPSNWILRTSAFCSKTAACSCINVNCIGDCWAG